MIQLSSDNIQSESQLIKFNSEEISNLKYFRDAEDIENNLQLNFINKSFNYIFTDSFAVSALNKKMFYIIIY